MLHSIRTDPCRQCSSSYIVNILGILDYRISKHILNPGIWLVLVFVYTKNKNNAKSKPNNQKVRERWGCIKKNTTNIPFTNRNSGILPGNIHYKKWDLLLFYNCISRQICYTDRSLHLFGGRLRQGWASNL